MFKELGQLTGILRELPRIKEEMVKMQQRLGQITADGDAGGGMVKVRLNGRFEMTECTITDDAMKLNDREMLEDLMQSAFNRALDKVRGAVAEETSKVTAGLSIPGMPDLSSFLGQ